MEFKFDAATFEMLQNLSFPLIKALTGFDPEEWVGDKSELFITVGESFGEVSSLFLIAGAALEDGRLSADELNEIIAQAATLPDALENILGFFDDDDEEDGDGE